MKFLPWKILNNISYHLFKTHFSHPTTLISKNYPSFKSKTVIFYLHPYLLYPLFYSSHHPFTPVHSLPWNSSSILLILQFLLPPLSGSYIQILCLESIPSPSISQFTFSIIPLFQTFLPLSSSQNTFFLSFLCSEHFYLYHLPRIHFNTTLHPCISFPLSISHTSQNSSITSFTNSTLQLTHRTLWQFHYSLHFKHLLSKVLFLY